MNRSYGLAIACALGATAGCATVEPRQDYERASRLIESATGQPISVDPEGTATAQQAAAELLVDGLTAQEAVQLALLNNPRLQAGLLQIGIGRAAVVQSGLYSNPSLGLSLRFPDGGGLADFQVSLAQNIAELWQIRPRILAAEKDLDQTILGMAQEASHTAFDAHSAYIRAVQAERRVDIAGENLAIAAQLVELAVGRRQAGSGTDIDVNLAHAERAALYVTNSNTAVAAVEAKSSLAKILGVVTPPHELLLTDSLPDAVDLPFTAPQLVDIARANRLDLKAADAVTKAAGARLDFERASVFKSVEIGISMERDARSSRGDRNWLAETAYGSAQAGALTPPSLQPREDQSSDYVTGPTLSMDLPLFDQNQAQIARAEFELLQANYLRDAIDREIIQESWAVHARAKNAFETVGYMREELLPLRESGLELARQAYRIGSTTLLTVLDAQRHLLDARAEYIDVQAGAGLAKIELERIAGQPISGIGASTTDTPSDSQGK